MRVCKEMFEPVLCFNVDVWSLIKWFLLNWSKTLHIIILKLLAIFSLPVRVAVGSRCSSLIARGGVRSRNVAGPWHSLSWQSWAAVPVPTCPAQHPHRGSQYLMGSPMMGAPYKGPLEADGALQGSSRKVEKVIFMLLFLLHAHTTIILLQDTLMF